MQRHVFTIAFTFALFIAIAAPHGARPGSAAPAKDVWLKIQSKHFTLIGDARETEIRAVGMRLELFREAFSQIFSQLFSPLVVKSSVPITVIVFKNDLAYKPFKPFFQGKPADVSGYFQSSGDIAYIALAAGRSEADPYAVILHEYVHALTAAGARMFPSPHPASLPTWLSEGLAEYFSTVEVTGGGKKVWLGKAVASHARLLRERPAPPLETLLAVDQTSPFYIESDKKNLFYAVSWALTHYLLHAGGGEKRPRFRQFIGALSQGKPAAESFKQAFQTDYAAVERELKNYIGHGSYPAEVMTFDRQIGFNTELKTVPLSEAEVQAYLGDLLWRIHRSADGETFLNRAISIDPGLAMAHLSLGTLRSRQNRYVEAQRHLRQAIEAGSQSHLAYYYYAFAIHRERVDESQYVSDIPEDSVKAMRAALGKARQLNPDFADTYKLLAFINLVLGEDLDEAVNLIDRAIALAPDREDIVYTRAQIQMRRKDYAAARQTVLQLAGGALKSDVRERANSMLENIAKIEERLAKMRAESEARGGGTPSAPDDPHSTRPPLPGQRFQGDQVRGFLTRIDCDDASITLTVKSESRLFKFHTSRREQLFFVRYTPEISTSVICGPINPAKPVIVTYRRSSQSGLADFDGEPIGVEFVKPDGM